MPTDEEAFFELVGDRIREIRTKKGLSQTDVANRTKSYQQNVARSEAGKNLTLDVIFRLAQALEVEPIEFFRFPKKQPSRGSKRSPSG